MSPEAERLREKLNETYCGAVVHETPREIATVICAELGITEEMVEGMRVSAYDSLEGGYEHHGHLMNDAATAFATLREVAGC